MTPTLRRRVDELEAVAAAAVAYLAAPDENKAKLRFMLEVALKAAGYLEGEKPGA